jgi:DNA-binding NarL/FixJ family response regulator
MSRSLDESYRFLLADDHNIVRQGIQMIVEDINEENEIKHASSIQQILQNIQTHRFDFAILDAQLQDGNCLNILPEIKKLQPQLKLMMFTSFEEETYSLKFIQAGADGFLSKLSTEEEIQNAVEHLITKGYYYPPFTQKLISIAPQHNDFLNPLIRLSEREMQIAKLYAKGLGNLEIANNLDLKQNTISTFKKRIFEKLEIDNLVSLIELFKIHHIEK